MSVNSALAILQAAGLVRPVQAQPQLAYRFRHALIQEAAYHSLLKSDRKALHLRVAEVLEALSLEPTSDEVAQLAHHFAEAGETDKAVKYLQQTVERALRKGAYPEALQTLETALTLASTDLQRAPLLVRLGDIHRRQGNYPLAVEHLRSGLTLARQTAQPTVEAEALGQLTNVAFQRGQYEEALQLGHQAVTLARSVGKRDVLALALRRLGGAALSQEDYPAAQQYFRDSLALYYEQSDLEGISACLNNLGLVADYQHDYATATQHYKEALAISRELGDQYHIGIRLFNLGEVNRRQGNYAVATQYYQEGRSIFQAIGDKDGEASAIVALGHTAAALGETATAHAHYCEALRLALPLEMWPLALWALAGLAALHAQAGQPEEAATWLGLALYHPASNADVKQYAEPIVETLRSQLGPETLARALERGRNLSLAAVALALELNHAD